MDHDASKMYPNDSAMTCSPTSSEEEMALSLSEGSGGDDSGSSREETRGPGATTVVSSRGDVSRETESSLVICVVIPDLQQSIVLNFESDATIWSAKQQVLCTLTQPLRDVLNYGLFQPAFQGRESGFLDEEQPLRQFSIPKCQGVPTLEFRYKSRVYKHTNVNEMLIAKINIQTNLRRFIECVQQLETDKVEKMLDRGLDPNYHDPENGETPLTLAVQLGAGSSSIIIALKNGGAHMDFRSQDGLTALHKAVKANNHVALKTLLDLGSSVNYKDSQSLTPLYHSVLEGGELSCCLLLLRYSATLGCSDENGWTEMHQACRYGHLKHLEQLLLFGADISSQNATGNTGLHISALHKQEPCVRLLLSIGACKDVKNYRGQTPFQVAITAGNFELADIIKNYKDNENVHLRESPRCASPFRVNHASPSSHWVPSSKQQLETAPVLLRSNSGDDTLDPAPGPKKSHSSTVVSTPSASPSFTSRRSPSPCHRSSSPTMPSPAVSTVKTVGGVRGGRPSSRSRSPSLGRPAAEDVRRQHQRHTSPHSGGGRAGPEPAHHRTREDVEKPRNNNQYSAIPARQFVAITPYHPQAEGEIALCKNDRVKVLCVGEGGYLKGSVRGNVGWFPAECVEEVPTQAQEDRPYTRHDHAERRKLFRNYTVGSYDSFEAASNRIIDEKTVVLQKRDNEGFGFVLRGAKADTPIEEFSPTPAFPALQYLESVDEGGVAWMAGLRTGDFLIKVNQDNVVKVGHKQVVNMIRHGGNRLIIKVVTVSRTLDPEKTNPKKVIPTPRRGPSTLLSMAMRSKSMTSELEELSTLKRKKDDDHAEKPMWDSNRNSTPNVESRKPPPKTRSSSRYTPFNPEINSIGDIQEVPQPSRAGPTNARAAYLGIPKQGIIRRQKSIGVTEEEKTFLSPPMLKLARSLSMPDTSEDIPPPPAVSPPSPPSPSPYTSSHPQAPEPEERVLYGGAVYPRFPQNGAPPGKGCPPAAEKAEDSEDAAWKRNAGGTAQQSFLNRCTPAQIPENPYSDRAKLSSNMGSFSVSKQARKGMLMKQPKVEDKPEKGSSISIPTIIIKEPSTSSSGKSSQASSMEVEPGSQDLPGQLRPDTTPDTSSVFVVPTIRSRRLADLRNSVSFRSTDLGDEEPAAHAPSRLRQSRSIDEGMLSSDEHFRRLVVNPLSLLNIPDSNGGSGGGGSGGGVGGGGGGGGGHLMDLNAPEPSMLRAPLNTRTGLHHSQQHQHHLSPLSLPVKTYTPSLSSLSSPASPSMGYGHYLHPVTGKPLDPSSPLALALAARDQAIRGQNQPQPLKTQESSKSDLNMPLFIDTKLARPSAESSFGSATVTPLARTGPRGALRRQMTESKYETDTKYEHPLAKDKKRAEPTQRDEDLSQHKRAGLLMVHTSDRTRRGSSGGLLGGEERGAKHAASKDHSQPASVPPLSHNPSHIHISPHKTFITVSSAEEPVKLPFGMIPPPPLASVDIPEDELFPESLPPPIEFANSFDISESQASSIAELLKQTNNLSSDQALAITEILKQTQNTPPGSASAARQSSVSPFYPSYFLPTNSQHEIKCAPAGLSNTMLPIYPDVSLDSFGPVGDSGIEVEVDSRSVGGDPQLETTGTASNVSSMSTLSSEGGGEGLDACAVYADGQAFTAAAMINKSNKSTKVKTHSVALHHRSGKEMGHDGMMAHRDESSYNGGGPPSYIPAPPAPGEAPRTSRDSGEGKHPHMSKAGETRRSRNTDFSSGVPRRNTVTFASTTVLSSLSCQEVITNSSALSGSIQRSPSPSLSPPPDTGLRHTPHASSSSPSSPALADLYVLPPLGSGISRSSSPLLSSPSASSNKPFASKPLVLWSKEDVADWLDHLNLSEHKDAFLDNDIEGSHLPSLQKDDLVDLGVTRVGHRMNIERALKDLMDM